MRNTLEVKVNNFLTLGAWLIQLVSVSLLCSKEGDKSPNSNSKN